jgi:hypothetical protein
MDIKLDENLGNLRVASWLRFAGHNVATVRQQNLTSTPDEQLIEICRQENRCFITTDRGFENRLKYNPINYTGIVVLRFPPHPNFEDWREAIDLLIQGLEINNISGKLWIIRQGKIYGYQPKESELD